MIENITVWCNNKEERQQWIDLLSQEVGLGLLRSPTTTIHVSCSHPPFTRLSRYYARLVRKKIIHPELMKKLLYLQYIYKPDLSHVKMRKCTVTYNIYPWHSQDSRSETSSLASDCEKSVEKKYKRPLHKSTLLLDVRYVFEDSPLEAKKLHLPSSTSLATIKAENCQDRISFETSKSLPATASSSQCFPSNLNATQFRDLGNENLSEAVDLRFGQDDLKNWKSLNQSQRTFEVVAEEWPKSFNELAAEARLVPTMSLRSSDSGMADSFHFNCSSMNSSYKFCHDSPGKYADHVRTSHSESDNDENKFENQCICSSPFGSTPRESEYRSVSSAVVDFNTIVSKWNMDESNVNSKIEKTEVDFDNSSRDFDDSGILDETAATFSQIELNDLNRKRFTQPIPCSHQSIANKVHKQGVRETQDKESHKFPQGNQVYTSGLYAHWWLKKTIPLPETADEGKLP